MDLYTLRPSPIHIESSSLPVICFLAQSILRHIQDSLVLNTKMGNLIEEFEISSTAQNSDKMQTETVRQTDKTDKQKQTDRPPTHRKFGTVETVYLPTQQTN